MLRVQVTAASVAAGEPMRGSPETNGATWGMRGAKEHNTQIQFRFSLSREYNNVCI